MFKWLSRGARTEKPEASASRDPVADAVLSVDALGRLPEDLLGGGQPPEPAPEYIQDAAEPSAAAWQHEREARAAQDEAES
jgi:transcriptional regulator of nitric oxide reductase